MTKWLLFSLLALASCMEDNLTPEASLKNFVEARFGNVVTRQFVIDRVTGKMRQSMENITDEEFKKFSDLRLRCKER